LQERALLDSLDSDRAEKEAKDAADKIRPYIQAHLAGETVEPDPAVAPIIEDLLSRQKIPPQVLRDLAAARASSARTILEREHGIDPARLEVAPPSAETSDGEGSVHVEIGAAS
jgi:hypothetical protein